ncbi:MAG: prepilin peptidase [Pirellulales bacterium]|nr:prepilin peptidase [Pirellulales bacterium]
MPPPSDTGWLFVIWLAVVGGAVGSFLNVVVYRLPLGLSLIEPPSHCPTCKRPIRWRDNVPVFGWIFLRGRCRDCGERISVRYPLVEALTAAMFAALAAVEHFSQGANLPLRAIAVSDNVAVGGVGGLQLYGTYLFHLLLLCTLLCAALIEYDGRRPPPRLFVPAFAAGLLAPLLWPLLRPVAAWPGLPIHSAGAVDGLAGLAIGGALGAAAWSIRQIVRRRSVKNNSQSFGTFYCLLCVGLYLGWQAVLAIALATAAIHCATRPLRRPRPTSKAPAAAWLFLLSFAWIIAWSRLVALYQSW